MDEHTVQQPEFYLPNSVTTGHPPPYSTLNKLARLTVGVPDN